MSADKQRKRIRTDMFEYNDSARMERMKSGQSHHRPQFGTFTVDLPITTSTNINDDNTNMLVPLFISNSENEHQHQQFLNINNLVAKGVATITPATITITQLPLTQSSKMLSNALTSSFQEQQVPELELISIVRVRKRRHSSNDMATDGVDDKKGDDQDDAIAAARKRVRTIEPLSTIGLYNDDEADDDIEPTVATIVMTRRGMKRSREFDAINTSPITTTGAVYNGGLALLLLTFANIASVTKIIRSVTSTTLAWNINQLTRTTIIHITLDIITNG
jgi:hypothetical protein